MYRAIQLTDIQKDALREVATICIGSTSISLSKMIQGKIDVNISGVHIVPINRVSHKINNPNELVTGIYSRISGDINGASLLILPGKTAHSIVDILNGRTPGTTKRIEEMGKSALTEVGSILTGSYLNALSKFLDIKINFSVPSIASDLGSAIVYVVLLHISLKADNSLVMQTSFSGSEEGFKAQEKVAGSFVLLLDQRSMHHLIASIDKRIDE